MNTLKPCSYFMIIILNYFYDLIIKTWSNKRGKKGIKVRHWIFFSLIFALFFFLSLYFKRCANVPVETPRKRVWRGSILKYFISARCTWNLPCTSKSAMTSSVYTYRFFPPLPWLFRCQFYLWKNMWMAVKFSNKCLEQAACVSDKLDLVFLLLAL